MSCSFKFDLVKNTIKRKEFETALELNEEFNLDLKKALFDAIGNDEELAMALIYGRKSLNLPLSEANENNQTPLFLACGLEKPRIAKAILKTARESEDVRILLNARDDNGWTPFHWACIKKRPKVVDSLINIAMDYYKVYDLMIEAEDESGKSGCDHFPEHFNKDSD